MRDKLTDKAILSRIQMAKAHMKRHAAVDRAACVKFHDASSNPATWITGDSPDWDDGTDIRFDAIPVAKNNILTVNLMTKVAAIAIGNPEVHVEVAPSEDLDEATAIEIAQKWWKAQWLRKNWRRDANTALLKSSMSGLGFVRYYWSDDGPQYEHVHSWAVGVDPNTRNWQDLKFATVCVRMSLRNALIRYPKSKHLAKELRENSEDDRLDSRTSAVEVEVYHDVDTLWVDPDTGEEHLGIEAHCIRDEVVWRGPNLYKRVPLLVYEGNIDPGPTSFPIGDFQLAAGLQAGHSDVTQIIFNKARNNGPVTVYAPSRFDRSAQEALKEGDHGQWLPVKGNTLAGDPPVLRIPGEEITQAEIEAKREMEQAIDAAMAITQYQRGVINQSVNFATEAAILANQSGARPVAARLEYELFLTRWASTAFWMLAEFGGPRVSETGEPMPATEEMLLLWTAAKSVIDVRISEGSTAFKDPAIDQQQSMQLFDLAARNYPLMMQLVQAGITDKLPSLTRLFEDVLRAFGRQEMENYFVSAPVQPQIPPVSGGPVGEAGGVPSASVATPPARNGANLPPRMRNITNG